MGARVLYFIVFRTPANFQFVGRGGSAASQTRMRVSSCKPLPTRCACYFYMVICASFYLDYRLFKVRSLRSRGGEIPEFASRYSVYGVPTNFQFLGRAEAAVA